MKYTEKNSKSYTLSMNNKESEERPLKLKNFGKLLLKVKLKLELLICSTRIMPTVNQTKRILVLLRVQISAVRLLNIPHLMKLLFAISLQFHYLDTLQTVSSIMINYIKSLSKLQRTSTES